MSNHSVVIVPVVLEPHGNADSLSIVRVGGFVCVVRTADWVGVDRAAYCIPDTLVPVARPEFDFLAPRAYTEEGHPYRGYARIRAMRLRGVWSEGLLAKCSGAIGDDVTQALGTLWYEPIEAVSTAADAAGVEGYQGPLGKYDVENGKRYPNLLVSGEPVIATEKLHGANGRWKWDGEQFWCGSRTHWKKPGPNAWWSALEGSPNLQVFLKTNPHFVVFGEALATQGAAFNYGGGMAAFDIYDTTVGAWMNKNDALEAFKEAGVLHVPVIYRGPYNMDVLLPLAEGKSVFSPTKALCREGIVVSPVVERTDILLGRVIVKIVGRGFLERS